MLHGCLHFIGVFISGLWQWWQNKIQNIDDLQSTKQKTQFVLSTSEIRSIKMIKSHQILVHQFDGRNYCFSLHWKKISFFDCWGNSLKRVETRTNTLSKKRYLLPLNCLWVYITNSFRNTTSPLWIWHQAIIKIHIMNNRMFFEFSSKFRENRKDKNFFWYV